MYWFDQLACSSPRLLVWCGDAETCAAAASDFDVALSAEVERRSYQPAPAVRAMKSVYAARAVLDRPVTKYVSHGPNLYTLDLATLDGFVRDQCPGGLLYQVAVPQLKDIAQYVTHKDQTLTYYGLETSDIREFLLAAGGRGIDRVVPVGEALRFSRFWDGVDILHELTRYVTTT